MGITATVIPPPWPRALRLSVAPGALLTLSRVRAWWRDLRNPAGLLTLARVPLGLLAPLCASDRHLLLGVYLLGVATDVLDGPIARRTGTTSQVGAYADSLADKVFHGVFAVVLAAWAWVPWWWIPLWFARELVQAGLIVAYHRDAFQYQGFERDALPLGKATTVLLGFTVLVVLLDLPRLALAMTLAVALVGLAAAVHYGLRERALRRRGSGLAGRAGDDGSR